MVICNITKLFIIVKYLKAMIKITLAVENSKGIIKEKRLKGESFYLRFCDFAAIGAAIQIASEPSQFPLSAVYTADLRFSEKLYRVK